MRTYILYFILFLQMPVFFGCENKQKRDNRAFETNVQQIDSLNCMATKSNLKKEDILSWELEIAIARLGEPIFRDSFPIREANGLSVSLHNYLSRHPADSSMLVREVTFEADDEMYLTIPTYSSRDSTQLNDMYLTIWYIEKDGQWKPIDFLKYYKYSQF